MGVIGAILGDIAGSRFEFSVLMDNGIRKTHNYDIFTDRNTLTDDTVMTIACMDACHNGYDFTKYYREYGRKYPDAGYGPRFHEWINNENAGPYNSFGNGSAMRCSYIGQFEKEENVEKIATLSAACTHNHPEGIKGAVVLATCVNMAENKHSKEEILDYGCQMYPKCKEYPFSCQISTEEYADTISYQISCQGSVPVAIRCFYETDSFEECMYLINSMKIDTDTVGAIAGAICDSYYGTREEDKKIIKSYLDTQENEYSYLYKKLLEYKVL